MAAKVRLTFLPVFLTLLSIAFTVALAYRIRSYRAIDVAAAQSPADSPSSAGVGAPAPGRAGGEGTNVPLESAPGGSSVNTNTTTAVQTARKISREQRYRELLAMGNSPESAAVQSAVEAQQQAKALPTPPPKPQSALQRLLQPIVKAVTPQPSPAPMPQPSAPKADTSRHEDKDPNSDTTPPQLISIEFNPPTVHDGEETMLIVNAVDDLSGIRGISGTLTSPTGKALQGFAQQREGETNRYVSRITIPKDAEEGTWRISFLNLSDVATNMTTLSYAQGTIPQNAVLKVVSSRSDSAPPTLRSVSIARRAMHTGETNTLYVEAEDDKSGVKLVSAVFLSPSRQARLGFGCRKGDGDTWECLMNPPECLDCGEWQLEQIQMQDNANNYTTLRNDNPMLAAVKVDISGASCDKTPPTVTSVLLDKSVVMVSQGETAVTVRVTVSDDLCGVGGVSGQVSGPGTNSGTFFAFAPEGGEGTGSWSGTFRLDPRAPRGTWKIQSITINDKGQNLRIYYSTDAVLGRAQFIVK